MLAMEAARPLRYCLYSRKSSEQDERQAMSIESQVNEMLAMAERESLQIVEIKRESHSAKESGKRPEFMKLIEEIRSEKFDGILTWAPDRLSRNAGDLGSLVDLMDANKLKQIRTYGQSFSNTPNEKFLLMILCSQAKLENDNKSVNVKRGIRAKCEMGIRPGPAPLGYINRSYGGVKEIAIDPDRAEVIGEMFARSAAGESGRSIKRWLDESGFRTKHEKRVTLSLIYDMLKNPFYYGEFDFGDTRYKGSHQPIVSRELFDAVQRQLTVPPKSKWGAKYFAFKGLVHCKDCGAQIVGEEKFKATKSGGRNRHVYYHCSRQVDYHCAQPYIREQDLIEEIIDLITNLEYEQLKVGNKIRYKLNEYDLMTREHIKKQRTEQEIFYAYLNYLLRIGDNREKASFLSALSLPLLLDDRRVVMTGI